MMICLIFTFFTHVFDLPPYRVKKKNLTLPWSFRLLLQGLTPFLQNRAFLSLADEFMNIFS